jgi:DNA-directed RNA polymerase specialized sigma24 family protein
MNPTGPSDETPPPRGELFATTRWNVVLAAADSSAPESQTALEQLCRTYWPPLYAFVRRNGYPTEKAKDLTQGFFAFILEHHTLHFADPHRGRFRNFLLAACKRYLQSEHRLASAQKRGAGITWLPWSDEMAAPPPADPPEHLRSAEACYEHQWALTLLGKVMRDLRAECGHRADPRLFEALKDHICMAEDATPYADLADQLGISGVTLRVTVHRLRERYRELLRAEIAHTVAAPAEIDDEIRHLIEVVGW